jgi:hypothetical protein
MRRIRPKRCSMRLGFQGRSSPTRSATRRLVGQQIALPEVCRFSVISTGSRSPPLFDQLRKNKSDGRRLAHVRLSARRARARIATRAEPPGSPTAPVLLSERDTQVIVLRRPRRSPGSSGRFLPYGVRPGASTSAGLTDLLPVTRHRTRTRVALAPRAAGSVSRIARQVGGRGGVAATLRGRPRPSGGNPSRSA